MCSVCQIYKYRRPDIIETHLKSAVVEGFDHQIDLINSSLTDFERYYSRLKLVRDQKQKLADVCGNASLCHLIV